MEAGDITGVWIAVAVGVLAFAISGAVTRHFAQRRADLQKLFGDRGMRPFYMTGAFDADALSRYFFEAV